jgi:hypothetical protein
VTAPARGLFDVGPAERSLVGKAYGAGLFKSLLFFFAAAYVVASLEYNLATAFVASPVLIYL